MGFCCCFCETFFFFFIIIIIFIFITIKSNQYIRNIVCFAFRSKGTFEICCFFNLNYSIIYKICHMITFFYQGHALDGLECTQPNRGTRTYGHEARVQNFRKLWSKGSSRHKSRKMFSTITSMINILF